MAAYLSTDLVATLASLEVNNFSHFISVQKKQAIFSRLKKYTLQTEPLSLFSQLEKGVKLLGTSIIFFSSLKHESSMYLIFLEIELIKLKITVFPNLNFDFVKYRFWKQE